MNTVSNPSHSSSDAYLNHCLSYLYEAAALNEVPQLGTPGEPDTPSYSPGRFLQAQYRTLSLSQVKASAAALYLAPSLYPIQSDDEPPLIFPFGINESQLEAVRKALTHQLSVIQGPPGTGKTQTILNILANLLLQGRTVQVVSGTNSAAANIQEKLAAPDIGLDFLTAFLGSRQNKEKFLSQQTGHYPDMAEWEMTPDAMEQLLIDITQTTRAISETFAAQKRLAQAREERRAIRLEQTYFEKFLQEIGTVPQPVRLRARTKTEYLLRLWLTCEHSAGEIGKPPGLPFWRKLQNRFLYGIGNRAFYRLSPPEMIRALKQAYYSLRLQELDHEIKTLETSLAQADTKQLIAQLTRQSRQYLRARIYEQFRARLSAYRSTFSAKDLFLSGASFCREYPIILSTTYSARYSLPNMQYDYLIMDEASQVDIPSGVLALSGARRAVIVGDEKQLPHVVPSRMRRKHEQLFRRYDLPSGYFAGEKSFLSSLCQCVPTLPQTLLREHYRCHPLIINFCNQKFYQNELLIMTEDHGESDVLRAIQTVPGHHQKHHVNQRQIDVIRTEALPILHEVPAEEIGIIAPYRDQVQQIQRQLSGSRILPENISTVHKFQGREKEAMIIATTDDIITPFSDDAHLMNVAISRARNHLVVIASAEKQPDGSNLRDLIAYIRYQGGELQNSEVRSIFDLLYSQYAEERRLFLAKHTSISQFASENLMYGLIEDLLTQFPELPIRAIPHVPLQEIFSQDKQSALSVSEQNYIHRGAHVDFLFYHTIRKSALFAIEVDGFHFHHSGTRQHQRDLMKDHICTTLCLPLLRFSTIGSRESAQLKSFLAQYRLRQFR